MSHEAFDERIGNRRGRVPLLSDEHFVPALTFDTKTGDSLAHRNA